MNQFTQNQKISAHNQTHFESKTTSLSELINRKIKIYKNYYIIPFS